MKVTSFLYENQRFTKTINGEQLLEEDADLVIGFGTGALVSDPLNYNAIREKFPNAVLTMASSAGEIFGKEVFDNTISLVAMQFDDTKIATSEVNIEEYANSFEAGKILVDQLPRAKLKLIFVLSDGGKVNGSELVKGINEATANSVLVTGGLAGDGAKFEKTYVGLNQLPTSGKIVAIGFYGDKLQVSHGSIGGWESFGLERTVTKSDKNILYEIDNKSVLDLYKNYLGKYAQELPGSALLFPLSIKLNESEDVIVRTILSIDEQKQSMTFAGDLPLGSKVRFMKANFDKLIDAASDAAANCLKMNAISPKVAILISCVGRKVILNNRIDEEVEAVSDIFNNTTLLTGFYSYGEISPLRPFSGCELHNQTMTITCLNEL
ncbi:FIST N-terminal domain-containing protein [Flavobacterium sp.]|uniref:FIST signal transduction protein n=1 Tax=Flavobacterium sp. TaxID=239 RepID=UPI0022BC8D41|nr:FIST N-terminal domain-containing protein [Flavobacterium sp.]MCZ8229427.1 FIST C-terminal domain-containing protein [Flavobacterium sp.]